MVAPAWRGCRHYLLVTEAAAHTEIVLLSWVERLLSGRPWRGWHERMTPMVWPIAKGDALLWCCHPALAPDGFGEMSGTIEITAELADRLADVAAKVVAEIALRQGER